LFRDDDSAYAGWLAANAHGSILNIERSMNPLGRPRSRGRLPDNHWHATARQDTDRALRQGVLDITDRTRRVGAVAR
jgi:hypothetical protein